MSSDLARLLLAALLLGAAPVRAAAPLSEADAQLLWEEAVATHDGSAYMFKVYVFQAEDAARGCAESYPACAKATSKPNLTLRLPEIPMSFRAQLAKLEQGAMSEAVHAPSGAWLVFEAANSTASKFPGDSNPAEWLRTYAAGSLPTAEALRTEPALKARRALNRLKDADQLAALMADGTVKKEHLDAPRSNGATPLAVAVGRGDVALVEALLAAGASPNVCGWTYCPLSLAVQMKQAAMTSLLLRMGANPDGVPGEPLPPLAAAAGKADRELTQLLLDAGANPLMPIQQGFGALRMKRSLLYFASSSSTEYLEWLAGVVRQRLDASGAARWSAWLEQDGKRKAITAGATVTLRAAPFKVVMAHPPGLEFRVAASEDPSLLEKGKNLLFRRDLFHESKLGASNAESRYLGVTTLGMEGDKLDWRTGCNDWGDVSMAGPGNGTKVVKTKGRTEFVYEVVQLIGVAKNGPLPLVDYRGKGLAILMGARPNLGTSSDLYEPIGFTLKLTGK